MNKFKSNRYCGEYFDNETDNIYLRARYYNPRAGRFITEDPVKDGLNWYGYCGGNPVAFVDPSGLRISMFKSDVKKVYRKEQKDIRLEELQKLTNDELYIDEKTEFVKYKNIAIEMTKPKGTFLIRELIDSDKLIEIFQDPNRQSEAKPYRTTDGLNLLDRVEININPINETQFISRDYFTGKLSEPICPKYIILGHELVHAHRRINNIPESSIQGKYNTYMKDNATGLGYIPYKKDNMIEELETTGITYTNTKTGEYVEASHFRYTENVLRRENKIGPRIRY